MAAASSLGDCGRTCARTARGSACARHCRSCAAGCAGRRACASGERDGGVALSAAVSTDVEEIEAARGGASRRRRCSAAVRAPAWPRRRLGPGRGETSCAIGSPMVWPSRRDAAEQAGDSAAPWYSAGAWRARPARETAHRELIRRLAAAGDRAAALATFDRFRDRLAQELRIAPSAATRGLVEGSARSARGRHRRSGCLPSRRQAPRALRRRESRARGARPAQWDRAEAAVGGSWRSRGPGIGRRAWRPSCAPVRTPSGALVLAGARTRTASSCTSRSWRRCAATSPNARIRPCDQAGGRRAVLAALVPSWRTGSGQSVDGEASARRARAGDRRVPASAAGSRARGPAARGPPLG